MTPKILFIESNTSGTGLLFFIRTLELGLEPILLSVEPNKYPFLRQFKSLRIREQTLPETLIALNQLGDNLGSAAGVWSSSDQGVELAALVAQHLGCPHASSSAIALCRDKYSARQSLNTAGLLRVECALVKTSEEAEAFAARLGGPSVVKPRSSTGSIGVRLCSTPDEARQHSRALLNASASASHEGVLVEAFVDGPEYSAEIFDGMSVGITRKVLGPPPSFIEEGHDFPAPGASGDLTAIAAQAELAVAALGHIRGPAHVEVRLSTRGPTIIEINPRLAGGMIPELVRRAIGVDLVTETIRFACGMPYSLAPSHVGAAAIRFLVRQSPDPIRAVEGLSYASGMSGVVDVAALDRYFKHSGLVADFRDRIAYVIAEAPTPKKAGLYADRALRTLHVVSDSQRN